jgi:anti-sigma factor RsiW
MQKTPDARNRALRPYLSLMVDGEMEPVEAIAMQRHVRQHPELAREVADIEQLKLSLHLAGRRDEAPPGLETRLRAQLGAAMTERREARQQRRNAGLWALAGALGLAALVVVLWPRQAAVPVDPSMVQAMTIEEELERRLGADPTTTRTLDGKALIATLIDSHRGDLPEHVVNMLRHQHVIERWERVPAGFVEPAGRRTQLVLASTMSCTERAGATLVILPAARVALPSHVENALETAGVFSERMEGVEVRYSRSGDKLFLVLNGDERTSELDPI